MGHREFLAFWPEIGYRARPYFVSTLLMRAEPAELTAPGTPPVPLATVLREWGRIGCTGFGGPPAHIRLLRQLCVERRGWIDAREFEDAIAVCNLMPGPASTQLAIFCAWRLRGRVGALIGGAGFILPGLVVILALAVLFVAGSPPLWVLGAGAGAGGAVPAVAVQAGWSLLVPSWRNRHATRYGTARWLVYLAAGVAAAAFIGEWLVLVLLGCGAVELLARYRDTGSGSTGAQGTGAPSGTIGRYFEKNDGTGGSGKLQAIAAAPAVVWAVGGGVLASVAWEAIKVGGLSFGGGFVIIPLMQTDAVNHYHWMTGAQFLNAVALGQITPGPVVQTVAVVGYAAAGITGGLLASAVAFAPSFLIVLFGGPYFSLIRGNARARSFLNGAGPAAIGAILGSAITLTRALAHPWQYAVLAAALLLLLPLRRGVVLTLLAAAAVGIVIALAAGTVSP
jgi:chromate transporter